MTPKISLAIACYLLLIPATSAWSQVYNSSSCDRYAAEATRQNKAKEALGLALEPPAWSSDFDLHRNWCREGYTANRTPQALYDREKVLQEYAVKTNQDPCGRYAREAVRQYQASVKLGLHEGLRLKDEDFDEQTYRYRYRDSFYAHYGWCRFSDNIQTTAEGSAARERELQQQAFEYNRWENDVSGYDVSFTTDFEEGFLRGWRVTGDAFANQPTKDDNPTARVRAQPSHHQGRYWIGTYEKFQGRHGEKAGATQGDGPTGNITSPPFTIGSEISFLIGGGSGYKTRVELLVDDRAVLRAHGKNTESMERVTWQTGAYVNKTGRIVIVDDEIGGWGHINVDDIVIVPKITETMIDRCSESVAISPHFRPTPDAVGTVLLHRGETGETAWTRPFQVYLNSDGFLGWWCNSTKGNWLDLGTLEFGSDGFDYDCGVDLAVAIGTKDPGKLCFPIENPNIGSSAVNGWTAERSRCKDRSTKIRARLLPDRIIRIAGHFVHDTRRMEIQCLGK
ncbi:MAG: hypothetical protein ACXW3S_10130 [Rhodoplanes sp.]